MKHLVFYSETAEFGGHETMALAATTALAQYFPALRIRWIIHSGNSRLAAALAGAGISYTGVDLSPLAALIRNPVSVAGKVIRLSELLRTLDPDRLLLVQGTITDGMDGAIAARICGIPHCSYLPMAHRWSELGLARRGVALRSALLPLLYRLTAHYITIDEQQAIRIAQQNQQARVHIVENYISRLPAQGMPQADARERLGIPAGEKVIGVIGRIEFAQKAQDWLVQTVQKGDAWDGKLLLFVGDGADRAKLAGLISMSPARDRMRMLGWRENMDEIYAALDLLLLPSRMEGVPLAMLEALARRIPVAGTDRDGMKSWLPQQWRFSFQDARAMIRAIDEALCGSQSEIWPNIEQHLAKVTDRCRFAQEFHEALARSVD